MKLYGLNNIVKCGTNIYYIDLVGERLHLKNEKSLTLCGITLDDDERNLLEDIEMSDWVLDALFTRGYDERYWVLDHSAYTIEKDEGSLYFLSRGSNILMYFDTVRELQNAYHFYSDYEDGNLLNEDIDTKLKKLFKLI